MYKSLLLIMSALLLSACGSPVVNNQTGVVETQSIYVVADKLVGYSVSLGALDNHTITRSDLMSNSLKVATSANSVFQKSDVIEIKAPQGESVLELKNSAGEVVYRKMIYLSAGQKNHHQPIGLNHNAQVVKTLRFVNASCIGGMCTPNIRIRLLLG
jgi:hypothetical protein